MRTPGAQVVEVVFGHQVERMQQVPNPTELAICAVDQDPAHSDRIKITVTGTHDWTSAKHIVTVGGLHPLIDDANPVVQQRVEDRVFTIKAVLDEEKLAQAKINVQKGGATVRCSPWPRPLKPWFEGRVSISWTPMNAGTTLNFAYYILLSW